ncbi:hypothetical protein JCM10908_005680 [Rhodotorula pacifica]|uniref:M1 family metallopeptidase n=1 Tax=Rhodotorula pacifica TaxID=1495444 RepID=UPI00318142CB
MASDTLPEQPSTRLPLEVVPSHYDFTIRTDLKTLTFSGTAEIAVTVHSAVPHIVLHVASPLVLEAAILGSAGASATPRAAEHIRVEEETQRAHIRFVGGQVERGEYRIGLRWNGVLNDSLGGYYRSCVARKGAEGKIYYGVTQFEPCHARQALPCFDEPALKATFAISLISRTGTVSLANTDVDRTEHLGTGGAFPRTALLNEQFFASVTEKDVIAKAVSSEVKDDATTSSAEQDPTGFEDDWEITHFNPTPKMSSYLLAWANGPFEHIESFYESPLTGRKKPIRMYATHDLIGQAQLALETTVKILPIYEKIFDIEYPLSKLDTLVASDFQGAMENWGLIIGMTTAYLWDPKKSGLEAKKLVVAVQSHEVAHQWFGNVVTMEWWDNLWLNESFATLMGEVIIPDRIEPSWRVHSAFIKQHLARALSLDALRSSHPIEMPCPDEDTIQQIFDALTYSKGASCLKMLSNFVGEEKFLKGVSIYLKKHLYGNARTADLMAGISEASGQDVGKIMDNWLTKTGFPLITVEETEKGLKVRQNRFFATADASPEEDKTLWHVPLQLLVVDSKTGESKVHSELVLSERETTVELADVANTTYKLNAETCGVYRTLYPASRLAKLGSEAGKGDASAFSLSDRMGLVQDVAVNASSGYAKTSGSLTLFSKLRGEKENLVWQEVATAVDAIISTWWEQPESVRKGLQKVRCDLFKPIAQRLGMDYSDSDDVDTTELRTLAFSALAESGDEETLAEYRNRFKAFLESDDDAGIPGDLKNSIYSACVRHGGEKEYEKVLAVYRDAPTPAHKDSAITGLCAPRDPALIDRTLNMVLTDEVRNQDVMVFVGDAARNPAATRKVWRWVQDNFATLAKRLGNSWSLSALVRMSFSSLTSEEDAQAVEAFFKDKDTKSFDKSLQQGLDAVRANAKWLERDADDVEQWLRENKYL